MFVELITFTLLLISLVLITRKKMLSSKLPPGPAHVPIFGNLLQVALGSQLTHLQLSHWASKYGPLCTIHLAHRPAIVLNEAKTIKELLSFTVTTGRIKSRFLQLLARGNYGIGVSEGERYLGLKNFCLRSIKTMTRNRSQLEKSILSDINNLCSKISHAQNVNGKLCMHHLYRELSDNFFHKMILGKKPTSCSNNIVHIIENWFEGMQTVIKTGLVFLPWMKYIAPFQSGYYSFKEASMQIYSLVERCFRKCENSKEPEGNLESMIEYFVRENKECQNPKSSFYGEVGRKHSIGSVGTFLLAANHSTGMTINWMVHYFCVFQDAQLEAQKEVDSVLGAKCDPSLEHKARMPFVEALVLETLRYSSLLPFGGIQELMEDIKFRGYHLPKGLLLIPNIYHANHDKDVWGDPENFRPGRFLQEGCENLKEYLVSFQPGKRSCPGEHLVKDILFLYACKLLQKFTFSIDPSVENLSCYLKPEVGNGFLFPKKLFVVVVPRT